MPRAERVAYRGAVRRWSVRRYIGGSRRDAATAALITDHH